MRHLIRSDGKRWRSRRYRIRKGKNPPTRKPSEIDTTTSTRTPFTIPFDRKDATNKRENNVLSPDRQSYHNQSKEFGLLVSYETYPYQVVQDSNRIFISGRTQETTITIPNHIYSKDESFNDSK